MNNNYNCERISRKGERLQYKFEFGSADAVMEFLGRHGMIGDLFGDSAIMVRKHGYIVHTLYHTDWLVEGEDKVLRFYKDEKHKLMYRPIDDELQRLRAFAREVYKTCDLDDDKILEIGFRHGILTVNGELAISEDPA